MIMKTILSILFLFVCAFAHAQYHNVEGIRVVGRSDSTTISNVGQIQFDADDDKFRFNDGTGWFSFLKEGETLPYWPLNGSASVGTSFLTIGSLIISNAGFNNAIFMDETSLTLLTAEDFSIGVGTDFSFTYDDLSKTGLWSIPTLSFGSSGSRLDDLSVYADASVSF